jgi:hypothetical protein
MHGPTKVKRKIYLSIITYGNMHMEDLFLLQRYFDVGEICPWDQLQIKNKNNNLFFAAVIPVEILL